MCGITGILAFNEAGQSSLQYITDSCISLSKRGPDGGGIYRQQNIALGHRRLSIIDTSNNGAQPMTDDSGRYTIVFNGEIFNYKELKESFFPDKGDWHSQSDTEVLLNLYIRLGASCLEHLSGFFAFAIYDLQQEELFLARDRFGKKPLLYYKDDHNFYFASEMKALVEMGIPKKLDHTALVQYLQLNYVPQPGSMLQGVQKLPPGHYTRIANGAVNTSRYYRIDWRSQANASMSYEHACEQLVTLMDQSVRKRMIADVPLGAFLSGGIDSSVVVALASRHTSHLNTFSIGYKDNPFFDETAYAALVAKKYQTNHTVFSLTNDDFLEHIENILNYIDEPFADSSAIPVYILSHHTRKHVTVALSGDGGDEVFAGYNKHQAEWRMRSAGLLNKLVKAGAPLWKILPKSRSSKAANIFRQLDRFAEGARLDVKERYWRWAGFLQQPAAMAFLTPEARHNVDEQRYDAEKDLLLQHLQGGNAMEDFLVTDMNLVLLSDMLTKVDLMSMANSLEIRSPFLDHEVVDFAFSLPTRYKIDGRMKKKIVQDAFLSYLPAELYNRPKKGFEIPLSAWFRKELKSMVTGDLLGADFLEAQGIFEVKQVQALKSTLFSANPGDAHATIWALLVFQHWWKKYKM